MPSSCNELSLRASEPRACAPTPSCPLEGFPVDRPAALVMRIVRFIGAAYETGDAACWEAAHERADLSLGDGEAELLVARVAAIVRLLRAERRDFRILPPPCRRVSSDEGMLLGLIRAAWSHRPAVVEAQSEALLGGAAAAKALARAVRALPGWPADSEDASQGTAHLYRGDPLQVDIGSKLPNKISSKEAASVI